MGVWEYGNVTVNSLLFSYCFLRGFFGTASGIPEADSKSSRRNPEETNSKLRKIRWGMVDYSLFRNHRICCFLSGEFLPESHSRDVDIFIIFSEELVVTF